jgi:hypothetical protein
MSDLYLINNPHVIHGSNGVHALGNVLVLNIDELTPDWSTCCVDIALDALLGAIRESSTLVLVLDTYTDCTVLQKFIIKIKEKPASTNQTDTEALKIHHGIQSSGRS